jgi:hypothetical protein
VNAGILLINVLRDTGLPFQSLIIGLQGTSICSRGPLVHRIPYKSGQFFGTFCLL